MPHSQGLSNNPYPEPKQLNFFVIISISSGSILMLSSHLRLDLPKGVFPVKILTVVLPSSITATWPALLGSMVLLMLKL